MNASGEFAGKAARAAGQVDVVDAGAADDGAAARGCAIRAKVKKTEAEVADGRITPAVAAEQIAEMLR